MRTVVRFGAMVALVAACESEPAGPDSMRVDRCLVDTHDEDGDGVVDACDNCPATANASQADTTEVAMMAFADRVGDACDLRPGLSGDEIAKLFVFDMPDDSRYVSTGWSVAGDQLRLEPGVTASWRGARGEQGDGLAAVVALDSTMWTDDDAFVQVKLDGTWTCTLHHAASGDTLEAGEVNGTMTTNSVSGTATAQTLIAWRRITAGPDEIECRVMRGDQTTSAEHALTDDLAIGAYELSTSGDVGLAIGSIVVFTSPGPKTP